MRKFIVFIICFGADAQEDGAVHLANQMARLTIKGEFAAANQLTTRALEVAQRLGFDEPGASTLLNEVAIVQQALGQFAEAERMYLKAIRGLEKAAPLPPTLAAIRLNLANLYLEIGRRPGEAEVVARRALREAIACFGSRSPNLGIYFTALATARHQQGDLRSAKRLLDEALAVLGDGESEKLAVAFAWQDMGVLEASQRQWIAANRHLTDAAALLKQVGGPFSNYLIRTYLNLAHMHLLLKQWALADEFITNARQIVEARLEPNHPIMVEILTESASIRRKCGRRREARELDRQAQLVLAAQPRSAGTGARVHVADLVNSSRN